METAWEGEAGRQREWREQQHGGGCEEAPGGKGAQSSVAQPGAQ